jgi:hypothetical protein
MVRYFEWMGAAMYTSDRRSGSMHGKLFLLDAVYAGIDEDNVYGRVDFAEKVPEMDFEMVVNLESWAADTKKPRRAVRLEAEVRDRRIRRWKASTPDESRPVPDFDHTAGEVKLALVKNFEFSLPLAWLLATPVSWDSRRERPSGPVATRLRLRFSLWHNHLPVDALPLEGWIELQLLSESSLAAMGF